VPLVQADNKAAAVDKVGSVLMLFDFLEVVKGQQGN
jgi:hypothetical protein